MKTRQIWTKPTVEIIFIKKAESGRFSTSDGHSTHRS
jgi:hypothetical protein